ncbi:hypothetical protein [Micromonospora coxensis]|uniref:Uncharacterized protein n=1 Tax=Micromonospora coxensis TaxID=356852 RepID=A0A1C5GW63_9ACTN|nr:hypothetical protein [Micromonospora coxensis]SCG38014.1 hypothetical protein GA0070614_0463 [Micromonospora coxensis]
MSSPDNLAPQPETVESVLRAAWEAFHPGQPTPLGWLTHTTARIHDHLHAQHTAPVPSAPPTPAGDEVARLRRQVWQTLHDVTAEHDIDPDAADRILHSLDLPGLPRRWQVHVTVPLTITVTATSRDEAVDAAEDVIDTALDGTDTYLNWNRADRQDTTPGDLDTTAGPPAELR